MGMDVLTKTPSQCLMRLVEQLNRVNCEKLLLESIPLISLTRRPEELNKLRDSARDITKQIDHKKEFVKLEKMISALLGTHKYIHS